MDTIAIYFKELKNVNSSKEESIELVKLTRLGDEKAKETLVKNYLLLVVKIAREYMDCGIPLSDLISEGNVGLLNAVEKFDISRGATFASCAQYWIKQSIIRNCMMNRRLIRLPENVSELIRSDRYDGPQIKEISIDVPNEEGNSLAENIADSDSGEDIYTKEEKKLLKEKTDKILSFLSERDANVIKAIYGIDRKDSLEISQASVEFNLTPARINQILNNSLKLMRMSYETLPGVKRTNIEIISAIYGVGDYTYNVTEKVKTILNKNEHVKANNSLGGDPCFGTAKKLTIRYKNNGVEMVKIFNEKAIVVF